MTKQEAIDKVKKHFPDNRFYMETETKWVFNRLVEFDGQEKPIPGHPAVFVDKASGRLDVVKKNLRTMDVDIIRSIP